MTSSLMKSLGYATSVVLAISLGWAGHHYARQVDSGPEGTPGRIVVTPGPSEVNPLPGATSGALQVWVVVGDRLLEAADRLALPGGTRFQIRLESAMPGRITLEAVTSGHEPLALLWQGDLTPGFPTMTPTMTLKGEKGLERLRLRFVQEGRRDEQISELDIWHM